MVNIKLWNEKRKEQNITLDELSKMTEISISTLKDIFRGKTTSPRIDTVQAIERALGLGDSWTDEEKAQGVGDYPVHLEPEELNWIELLNRVKDTLGEQYLNGVLTMLELALQQKK